MTRPIHQKVTASHLRRDAYLYVRQSTVRQVFETPRAPDASTPCASERWRWAGPLSECT